MLPLLPPSSPIVKLLKVRFNPQISIFQNHEAYLTSMRELREKEWTEFEAELARKRLEMDAQTDEHLTDIKAQHEKVEKSAVRL